MNIHDSGLAELPESEGGGGWLWQKQTLLPSLDDILLLLGTDSLKLFNLPPWLKLQVEITKKFSSYELSKIVGKTVFQKYAGKVLRGAFEVFFWIS